MKNIILILSTTIALAIFFSCKDDDSTTPVNTPQLECTFEQIDDNMDGLIDDIERSIMDECKDNALLVKEEAEANLIGTWNLIGHGEGWVKRISQPCSSMTFSEDELVFTFSNNAIDTIIITPWEVTINGGFWPQILHTEKKIHVSIDYMCSQYMFSDHTDLDGNMYLYEKVE